MNSSLFVRSFTVVAAAVGLLAACGGGSSSDAPQAHDVERDEADAALLAQVATAMAPLSSFDMKQPAGAGHDSRYPGVVQTNLVANRPEYHAQITLPELVNAWGIAIRPAGAGGHFWIGAAGTGQSIEFVGDVGGVPLHQDELATVATGGPTTGVAFNGGSQFTITQPTPDGDITNPAKFFFANASGTITAWTERQNADGSFDRPADSVAVVDNSARFSAFLGVTVTPGGDAMYAADFGADPQVRIYDGRFAERAPLANPFRAPRSDAPFEAFNVQTLGERVFVAYGRHVGPTDPRPAEGRLAEFDAQGRLVARWIGRGMLNYPWGVAVAPDDFGIYGGCMLVGNFGDGTIVAFHPRLKVALDYVRDARGERVVNEGLWGLQFGNGASLGEANHLYFAAGPNAEQDGLFAKLQANPAMAPALQGRSICR
jgi:uncharacterized protein (TIGR03118 family)